MAVRRLADLSGTLWQCSGCEALWTGPRGLAPPRCCHCGGVSTPTHRQARRVAVALDDETWAALHTYAQRAGVSAGSVLKAAAAAVGVFPTGPGVVK